jgi:hypothetical protein
LLAGTNLGLFGYSGAWLFCAVVLVFYLAWAVREYARDQERPAAMGQQY